MKKKNDLLSFTLIELLIVIAVIAILAGLLLPALNSAREKALEIKCTGNMKQLGLAWEMYESAYGVTPQIQAGGAGPYRGWYGQLYLGGLLKPGTRKAVYDGVSADNCFTLRCDITWRLAGITHPRNYAGNATVPQRLSGNRTDTNYQTGLKFSYKSSSVTQPSQRIRLDEGVDWMGVALPSNIMSAFTPPAYTMMAFPHKQFRYANFLFIDGHAGSLGYSYLQVTNNKKLHLGTDL